MSFDFKDLLIQAIKNNKYKTVIRILRADNEAALYCSEEIFTYAGNNGYSEILIYLLRNRYVETSICSVQLFNNMIINKMYLVIEALIDCGYYASFCLPETFSIISNNKLLTFYDVLTENGCTQKNFEIFNARKKELNVLSSSVRKGTLNRYVLCSILEYSAPFEKSSCMNAIDKVVFKNNFYLNDKTE